MQIPLVLATNALLERKRTPSALLITKGFRDLHHIGYQNRPRLFDLSIKKPNLLYPHVIKIEERIRILSSKWTGNISNKIITGASCDQLEILQHLDEDKNYQR